MPTEDAISGQAFQLHKPETIKAKLLGKVAPEAISDPTSDSEAAATRQSR